MFHKHIPASGLALVKYSGEEFIDRVGEDIVRGVVYSILTGKNVRDLTEGLTQRRVLTMNAALMVTYIRALRGHRNLEQTLTQAIGSELRGRITPAQRAYLYWFLGLTGKSLQNVARDEEGFARYLDEYDRNLRSVSVDVERLFGPLTLLADFEGKEALLKWPNLVRCLLAVGAQTLTVRGSEKSMYGKVFEKLVLGSVLSILGFTYIDRSDLSRQSRVFWLSERGEKRESDATVLVRPGMGIRFDIGFIGRGNSEVSLDKVTRFESQMRRGGLVHDTITVILVDTLGPNSRNLAMAHALGAELLQMSERYWVWRLAQVLRNRLNYASKLSALTDAESLPYIRERLERVDLTPFLRSSTVRGENV